MIEIRGYLTSRPGTTTTGSTNGLLVLNGGVLTSALAHRARATGAAGARDGVLNNSLVTGAVEGRLLSAGASGLLGCKVVGLVGPSNGEQVEGRREIKHTTDASTLTLSAAGISRRHCDKW